MRSLRARLGLLVGCGAAVLVFAAAVAIAAQRWQTDTEGLRESVELASFQLSETSQPEDPTVSVSTGRGTFGITIDGAGEQIGTAGTIPAGLDDGLIEGLWLETTDQDTITSSEAEVDGQNLWLSAVACTDPSLCDTAVVGAFEQSLTQYLTDRWLWLIGPALATALIAVASSRWLVGRSLRPVEVMREELATITARDLDRRVTAPHSGDELEQLGQTLNATIDRLATAVGANERFVADAAHELRSPITGVRAALEVEAAKAPGTMLDPCLTELDRAGRLVEDLLVLARQTGAPERVTDVDLDDLIRAELRSSRARFGAVAHTQDLEPVRLLADADALQRIIANLVENGCRHGGGQLAVSLASIPSGAQLTVDDDGPGIAPADRDRVFERFARLDESRSRQTGGSGLGLAIVAQLVDRAGGDITIGESPLGGARFTVNLPRQPVGSPAASPGTDEGSPP